MCDICTSIYSYIFTPMQQVVKTVAAFRVGRQVQKETYSMYLMSDALPVSSLVKVQNRSFFYTQVVTKKKLNAESDSNKTGLIFLQRQAQVQFSYSLENNIGRHKACNLQYLFENSQRIMYPLKYLLKNAFPYDERVF